MKFKINTPFPKLKDQLKEKIDSKTKPLGALGLLEDIALKIGLIQNSLNPSLSHPSLLIFAADHGIAQEGVSAYPPEVTAQMVYNFLKDGAAINVFCNQHKIDLKIIDAGINHNFPQNPQLIDCKISYGTQNFLKGPAMTLEQAQIAIQKGAELVKKCADQKCNIIGLGEMGIGNTSSASALMSLLCELPIEECVGRGTGLENDQLEKKKEILKKAIENYPQEKEVLKILSYFGGFEIAMMVGAVMKAAELKMIILVDGFISTSSILTASKIYPSVLDYCIFSHCSNERAHKKMLEYLKAEPLLNLRLRLGEGTGAAIAFPIIQSAVNFLNEMASFKEAGVSEK